jgi:enamine deaminase RidA (YjgF/YER057c/UK114 family)
MTVHQIVREGQLTMLSRIVKYAGVAYVTGLTAADKTADIAGQTEQVLARLAELLREAGTDKTRLLSVNVFLSDMNDKDGFNAVWTAWLAPEFMPTRAVIGSSDLGDGTLIEIVATAAE